MNFNFALGIAIDYSAHIAHKYLTITPPDSMSNSEKREYKVRLAISQMGSSVFHGGFSTFLAISLMGFGRTYVFQVYFKTWIIMITFGMLNGIILLPIILSMFGPLSN